MFFHVFQTSFSFKVVSLVRLLKSSAYSDCLIVNQMWQTHFGGVAGRKSLLNKGQQVQGFVIS